MRDELTCIYHSRDLDGWMSAAIVKLKYPDVVLIGWDYGQPIPEMPNDMLIICDVSFKSDVMRTLGYTHNVTWIDHHASAIKDSVENAYTIYNGLRDPNFAACELMWKYLFPDQPMPEIVRLLGRYDCFGHKGTDEEQKVLEVQYGARAIISNPDEAYKELNDNIHCDNTELQIWSIGRGIYKYLCSEAKQTYLKRYTVMFDTYKFGIVNQERFNPINFGIDYHKDGYEGFACAWYQNGKWMYSLYNDNGKIDCSDICKSRGGGGHKGAAGFQSDVFLT